MPGDIDHLFAYTYSRLDYVTVYVKLRMVFKRTNQETVVPCGCHSLTQASSHVWWVPKKRPIHFGAVMSSDGIEIRRALVLIQGGSEQRTRLNPYIYFPFKNLAYTKL